ncbi:MAG TPA: hypothetical protein VLS89_20215 [Candidatus Nanopelagicales bacterium]|nr:hypothetical protein [Candidatus Nanopelagicales bacterium]
MRLSRPLRWTAAALFSAIAAACGARSALLVDERALGEGGSGGGPAEDAGLDAADAADAQDAEPDVVIVDCQEAGIPYVYLVTSENNLYSFNPGDGSLILRGAISCPGTAANPFSMGVDRQGTAYVLFGDGQIFRVSTLDASCEATDFAPGQLGFNLFGMGFSTDEGGPTETLYVAEINFNAPSLGLASIDVGDFDLTYIGSFSENPGNAIEMTGTGDGRLFGYFINSAGPGGVVVEIDKQTADILSSTPLPAGGAGSSLAFAFWGGDFYIFTSQGGGTTEVNRYSPGDGSVSFFTTLPQTVVGAGVSTCAPQQ